MKNFFKGKVGTFLIILATLVLAGVAIFTAIRLYQLRSQPVAPNVPSSIPKAQEVTPTVPPSSCVLTFSLVATASPSPTPTATPVPQCNDVCTTSAQCSSGLTCNIPTGATTGNCRNTQCLTEADCTCATATPTATPVPTPNSCNGTCGSNSNCANGLICSQGFCRNPSCTTSANCACSGTPGPTGTPAPTLPQSGTTWPTIVGATLGIFVILTSLLIAL
ncbi:MAG TPA: hypothetical protein VFI61_03225 [Patescibacteria group bacterium]|nr:hypothetical protein [Patescibacteria group bacterium]